MSVVDLRQWPRLERDAPAVALRFPQIAVEKRVGTLICFLCRAKPRACLHAPFLRNSGQEQVYLSNKGHIRDSPQCWNAGASIKEGNRVGCLHQMPASRSRSARGSVSLMGVSIQKLNIMSSSVVKSHC